jgi:hypothetical protein
MILYFVRFLWCSIGGCEELSGNEKSSPESESFKRMRRETKKREEGGDEGI